MGDATDLFCEHNEAVTCFAMRPMPAFIPACQTFPLLQ